MFTCVCGKSFKSKRSLGSHKTGCEKWRSENKNLDQNPYYINGKYVCNCGKKFLGIASLATHGSKCKQYKKLKNKFSVTKYKINENLYRCECKREFDNHQSLNGHFGHCNKHRKAIGKKEFKNNERTTQLDGKRGWSKGLTKETDERVAQIGKTISERYSGKNHYWYNKKHSKETKNKISKSRTKYLNENDGYCDWFKVKNIKNEIIKVQGTWERDVANWLNDNKILFKRELLRFNDYKRYTPDFYLPEYNEYIEVKGFFKEYDKVKMYKVLEDNDVIIRMIDEDIFHELDKYDLKNLPIFEEKYLYDNIDQSYLKLFVFLV